MYVCMNICVCVCVCVCVCIRVTKKCNNNSISNNN